MKAAIALVTLVSGTLLILLPTMYGRNLDSAYCMWSIIVGIGMCVSGVMMGFKIVGQVTPAAYNDAAAA